MEALLRILNFEMPTPTGYGWFHLLWVAIIAGLTVFVCIRYRDCDDKTFRRILLITWLVIVILELYKEFIHLFSWEDGHVVADYAWYIFPFQFCSTPFYVLPFVIFCKDGIVRRACTAFTAFFALFAGIAVFIYPEGVFIDTMGVDIQTMAHHGSQVFLGIFLCARYRKVLTRKFYFGGAVVFVIMAAIAQLLNELFYLWKPDTTFNMFYVSRHWACPLPLLSLIYPHVNPVLFFVMYILGFWLAAYLVYLGAKGIAGAANRKKVEIHA